MPYKDPERKRQWEREHREQRNARRRALRVTAQADTNSTAMLNTHSDQQSTSGWMSVIGLVVGAGIIVLSALARAGFSGQFGSSAGSGASSV